MRKELGRYRFLAAVYDQMKSEVDYATWSQYIIQVWQHYAFEPRTVLDLACGTGGILLHLAQQGYEMTGVDLSEDMLAVAYEKSSRAGLRISLFQQDMRDLQLDRTFDAVICLCDSINYLLSIEEVQQCFAGVYRCLNPGGLFVFDVNTARALEMFYGTGVYYDEIPGGELKWETRYHKNQQRCQMDLTFFVQVEGEPRVYRERHIEQAYSLEQLMQGLERTHFRLLDVFEGFTLEPAREESYRWNFVAQRRG
ncbi:MAG TPA: class I SAM-dependent methyltransferase [Firmicutes bacterium]|nr:class I SAM-dependent methyltransferase [Bacillota bacterium]